MVNLLEQIRPFVSAEQIEKIGGVLGETDTKTESAFASAVSSVLAGLANSSISPDELLRASGLEESDSVLVRFAETLTGHNLTKLLESGSKMLKLLFDRHEVVTTSVSVTTGIAKSSARSLLSLVTPVVVSAVIRYVRANKLDNVGLTNLLVAQPSLLANEIPDDVAKLLQLGVQDVSNSCSTPESLHLVGTEVPQSP